ncbi:C-5 cytosine methyltransferase,S-adenosyl-L-methionine-dependent methyltransferase,DNA methylase, C-5 [Cinara cedri]|uniref:Cytosine-specific methyltransferase n=1 Tax=Cinara cedri TaxID=506608 RepID=A0A5E4M4U0_9HEMI|nr:C-5 cytosine methyltransferase,S-adenosyl-L-methionine-dependent methyltransferase,DNA methylase, C-5 [Cinara cedri]
MSGLPSKATTTPLVAEIFEKIFATQLEKHDYEEVLEEHDNTYEKVPAKLDEKIYVIAKQDSSTDYIIGLLEYVYREDNKLMAHISLLTHVGKCYVANIMNIRDPVTWSAQGPDRFYFKYGYNSYTKKIISEYSLSCDAKLTGNEVAVEYNYDYVNENKKQFIPLYKKISPLKGMDLFAGCGGFSKGLENSGSVMTKWAVEIEHNAAKAFKLNNTDAIVFNDDCNKLLKLVLSGKRTNDKNQKIPERGEVDIIFGGPPCQGFSGMNRFSYTEKSMRLNALSATFLSYINFYKPKFLLMENVKNYVTYDGGNFLSSTIKCLLQMGYQISFGILQGANFGIPQNRRRLIIMGAAPGETLPFYPKPKHVFHKKYSGLDIKFGDKMYKTNCEYEESAPMRAVTIYDAISDLPIISNGANNDILEYQNQPITSYQKSMRYPNKQYSNSILTEHICKLISPLMEGRLSLLFFGLDWRYLPNIQVELSDGTITQILKYNHYDQKNGNSPDGAFRGVCNCVTTCLKECKSKKKQNNTLIPYSVSHTANNNNNWAGVVGKLNFDGIFPTITQNTDPLGKQGTVFHPEQSRITSVRECGRAQGFDDEFTFYGPINAKHSQIGNAVSPLMAKAIGEEIVKAVINKSEK